MITPKFQWFFHELNSGGKMLSSVVVVAGTKLGSQVFNESSSIKFLVFFLRILTAPVICIVYISH
jgi:hypothetical protein